MEKNLAVFNQINSLAYWFLNETDIRCTVTLDATDDSYFISMNHNGDAIYKHHIEDFSKKDKRLLSFELSAIAAHLLQIKRSIERDSLTA